MKVIKITKNLVIGQTLYFDIIEEYSNRKGLLVYGINQNKTNEDVWRTAEYFLKDTLKYLYNREIIDNVERMTLSEDTQQLSI